MADTPKKLTHDQKMGLLLGGNIDKAYFEALGRFMDEFSNVEAVLYLFLVSELKLDLKMAASVLSGAKAAECISSLKRIFECQGKTIPATTAEVFEHIGTLNTARNEIVHYGAWGKGLFERTVSTELKSHTEKKAKLWSVSADILTDMYFDAEKATHMILVAIEPEKEVPAGIKTILARAWQYKYPSNPTGSGKKQGQKDQPTAQAPKDRPEPSGR